MNIIIFLGLLFAIGVVPVVIKHACTDRLCTPKEDDPVEWMPLRP